MINQLQNHTVIKNKGHHYQYSDLYLNDNDDINGNDITADTLKSIHENYEQRIHSLRQEMEEKERLWNRYNSKKLLLLLNTYNILLNRKFIEQEAEIDRMQEKYKLLDSRLEERLLVTERNIIRQFSNNENILKSKIEELQQLLEDKEKGIQDRYSIEIEANNLATLARIEAREEEMKADYEKRLKAFEKSVLETQQTYVKKELVFQGTIDQHRYDLACTHKQYEAKIDELREELSIKDRRLGALISKEHETDKWKKMVKYLSTRVIQACASAKKVEAEFFVNTSGSNNASYLNDMMKGFDHYQRHGLGSNSKKPTDDEIDRELKIRDWVQNNVSQPSSLLSPSSSQSKLLLLIILILLQ